MRVFQYFKTLNYYFFFFIVVLHFFLATKQANKEHKNWKLKWSSSSYFDKESIYHANFWFQNNESFKMSEFSLVYNESVSIFQNTKLLLFFFFIVVLLHFFRWQPNKLIKNTKNWKLKWSSYIDKESNIPCELYQYKALFASRNLWYSPRQNAAAT